MVLGGGSIRPSRIAPAACSNPHDDGGGAPARSFVIPFVSAEEDVRPRQELGTSSAPRRGVQRKEQSQVLRNRASFRTTNGVPRAFGGEEQEGAAPHRRPQQSVMDDAYLSAIIPNVPRKLLSGGKVEESDLDDVGGEADDNQYTWALKFRRAEDAELYRKHMKRRVHGSSIAILALLTMFSHIQIWHEDTPLAVTFLSAISTILFVFLMSCHAVLLIMNSSNDALFDGLKGTFAEFNVLHHYMMGEFEGIFCVSVTLAFSLAMAFRVAKGSCSYGNTDGGIRFSQTNEYSWWAFTRRRESGGDTSTIPPALACNPNDATGGLPYDTLMLMYLMPLVIKFCLKGVHKYAVLVSLLIATGFLMFATTTAPLHNGMGNVWIILNSALFYFFVLYEHERFNMHSFLTSKLALEEALATERIKYEHEALMMLAKRDKATKEQEQDMLRSLIGNVAHDLKTPLQAFTMGLEQLEPLLTTGSATTSTINISTRTTGGGVPAHEVIYNMQASCSFMTMAINRAIDYTKASKNIALVPKMETFDAFEALEFQIRCINSLRASSSSPRSHLEIIPPSLSVPSVHKNTNREKDDKMCRYILTDKLWLSENLLCLLSNAVKFSDDDTTVTVTVQLLPAGTQLVPSAATAIRRTLAPFRGCSGGFTGEDDDKKDDDDLNDLACSQLSGWSCERLDSNKNPIIRTQHPPLRGSSPRTLPTSGAAGVAASAAAAAPPLPFSGNSGTQRAKHLVKFRSENSVHQLSAFAPTSAGGGGSALAAARDGATATAGGGSSQHLGLVAAAQQDRPPTQVDIRRHSGAGHLQPLKGILSELVEGASVPYEGGEAAAASGVQPPSNNGLLLSPRVQQDSGMTISTRSVAGGISAVARLGAPTFSTSATAPVQMVRISVEDTGVGLSDENKRKLFRPFKQAQRFTGGTGLGLYSLSKRMEALGGYYGVTDRLDGKRGSLFWFAFPYRPNFEAAGAFELMQQEMAEQGDGATTDEPLRTGDVNAGPPHCSEMPVVMQHTASEDRRTSKHMAPIRDSSFSQTEKQLSISTSVNENCGAQTKTTASGVTSQIHSATARVPSSRSSWISSSHGQIHVATAITRSKGSTTAAVGGASLRVLVVDDSLTILKMVSRTLEQHGFVVDTAKNGSIGLNKLIESNLKPFLRGSGDDETLPSDLSKQFDIVLMDLQMPVMDGIEAVKRYRSEELAAILSLSDLPCNNATSLLDTRSKMVSSEGRQPATTPLVSGVFESSSSPAAMRAFKKKVHKRHEQGEGQGGPLPLPPVDELLAILMPTEKNRTLSEHCTQFRQPSSLLASRVASRRGSFSESRGGAAADSSSSSVPASVIFTSHPPPNALGEKPLVPIAIIGMSANSDAESKQCAKDVGMDYFIEKPFVMADFLKILDSIEQDG